MTRASVREYGGHSTRRYVRTTRAEKGQLLDEVVAVAGIHRKTAIPAASPRTVGAAPPHLRACALARHLLPAVQILVPKTRRGARVHRVYDRAQTPYQRLLPADVLSPTNAPSSRRSTNASTSSNSGGI